MKVFVCFCFFIVKLSFTECFNGIELTQHLKQLHFEEIHLEKIDFHEFFSFFNSLSIVFVTSDVSFFLIEVCGVI